MDESEGTVIDAEGRRRHFHGTTRTALRGIEESGHINRGSCFSLQFCVAAAYTWGLNRDEPHDQIVLEVFLSHDQFEPGQTKRENFWLREDASVSPDEIQVHQMAALTKFCPGATYVGETGEGPLVGWIVKNALCQRAGCRR